MRIIFFSFIIFLLLASASLAATPQTLSVQGKLTDTLNNPYTGSKNFIFRIYDSETGGTPLYTEFWNSTTQKVSLAYGGYFSVLLGTYSPLTLPFDRQYWLEMSVEGETLSPRTKLSSTPYTYRANITENLAANANSSGNLNMNSFNITNAGFLGLAGPGLGLGNALLRLSASTGAAQMLLGAAAATSSWTILSGLNHPNDFAIAENTTARFYIQNVTGNVGIGTTGPGQKLTVVGTIESTSGGFKFPDSTTQTTAAFTTFTTNCDPCSSTVTYSVVGANSKIVSCPSGYTAVSTSCEGNPNQNPNCYLLSSWLFNSTSGECVWRCGTADRFDMVAQVLCIK